MYESSAVGANGETAERARLAAGRGGCADLDEENGLNRFLRQGRHNRHARQQVALFPRFPRLPQRPMIRTSEVSSDGATDSVGGRFAMIKPNKAGAIAGLQDLLT